MLVMKPLFSETSRAARVSHRAATAAAKCALRAGRSLKSLFLLLFCLHAGLPCAANAAQQTILVFGDSLSAGYGLPREAGWVTLLQNKLQQSHPHYQVINASISGETSAGGRQRISQALREHKPAIVILELGTNDGLRGTPTEVTRANLGDIIRQCVAAHAKVLLLGMRLPPNYGEPYITQFHELFPGLARRYHIVLLPFMLEGIAANQFQADNLHPTAAAQPQILRNVMQPLNLLLSQRKD